MGWAWFKDYSIYRSAGFDIQSLFICTGTAFLDIIPFIDLFDMGFILCARGWTIPNGMQLGDGGDQMEDARQGPISDLLASFH